MTASLLSRQTLWILTVGCAIAVANLYYAQPLLAVMATEFGVSERAMGLAATLAQVGFALGMLLIVPLGDVVQRRRLILTMLVLVAMALAAVGLSPSYLAFAGASFVLGLTSITPQLIVPFAAALAEPSRRGRVVGMVMSGLLVGILISRTVSGFLGNQLGWRAVYGLAAGLILALAVLLRLRLPPGEPEGEPLAYGPLLGSLVGLFRDEPVLRQSCLFGAATFAAFSAFWNTLAFHLAAPPLELGSDVVGLFGLIGVAGAVAASVVGRLADRYNPLVSIAAGFALLMLSFVLFLLAGTHLILLGVGVVVMDLGVQASHISNQARIFALRAEVRNRLNTIYMACYFVGGALGSGLGSLGWGRWGWPGVCGMALGLLALGLTGFLLEGSRWVLPRTKTGERHDEHHDAELSH